MNSSIQRQVESSIQLNPELKLKNEFEHILRHQHTAHTHHEISSPSSLSSGPAAWSSAAAEAAFVVAAAGAAIAAAEAASRKLLQSADGASCAEIAAAKSGGIGRRASLNAAADGS